MSGAAIKAICREYVAILRSEDNEFQDQAEVRMDNPGDPFSFTVVLTPTQGLFKGARIMFTLKLPEDYPKSKPKATCWTKIFHPNVNFSGEICYSMFKDDWSSHYRISTYVNGLLYLLDHPNHDSPLNSTCVEKESEEFAKKVRLSISGNKVNGEEFEDITYCGS